MGALPADLPGARATAVDSLERMQQSDACELLDRYIEHQDVAATHLPDVVPNKYVTFLGTVIDRSESDESQRAAMRALSVLGKSRCLEPLARALRAPSARVRREALRCLLDLRADPLDTRLLGGDRSYVSHFLDPRYTVFSQARMRRQARELGLPLHEIQRRYEALARDYDLFIEVPGEDADTPGSGS
jgi:HEAT repeat protein